MPAANGLDPVGLEGPPPAGSTRTESNRMKPSFFTGREQQSWLAARFAKTSSLKFDRIERARVYGAWLGLGPFPRHYSHPVPSNDRA